MLSSAVDGLVRDNGAIIEENIDCLMAALRTTEDKEEGKRQYV